MLFLLNLGFSIARVLAMPNARMPNALASSDRFGPGVEELAINSGHRHNFLNINRLNVLISPSIGRAIHSINGDSPASGSNNATSNLSPPEWLRNSL